MLKKLQLIINALLLLIVLFPTASLNAQSSSDGGITLSEPKQEVSLVPGQKKALSFTIKNIGTTTKTIAVTFEDFIPNDKGEPQLIADSKKNDDYGLSSWMSGNSSFTLAAGQQQTYTTTLTVPNGTAEKTRYGIVHFTASGTGKSVSPSIGGLVLANIGSPKYSGKIGSFVLAKSSLANLQTASATFDLTIQNSGVFMFLPTLSVKVLDNNGKTLATLQPKVTGNILPNSDRLFSFDWTGSLDENLAYSAVPQVQLPDSTTIDGAAAKATLYVKPSAIKDSSAKTPKKSLPIVPIIGGLVVLILFIVGGVLLIKKRKNAKKSTTAQIPQPTTYPPVNIQTPVFTPTPPSSEGSTPPDHLVQ